MAELALKRVRRARRITLVALVDLVIILLIYFMLRTNFLQPRQVSIATPAIHASSEPPPRTPLNVELHADGTTWVDGRNLGENGIRDALAARPRSDDDRAVISVDPGVLLQRAVSVIDIMHSFGLKSIALHRARHFD